MEKIYFACTLEFFMLIVMVLSALGQTKPAIAKTEKITINKKGEIHNHGWNKIGFISKAKIVKHHQGKTIYFIEKNGNIVGAAGKLQVACVRR